jgi:hypothetical protein
MNARAQDALAGAVAATVWGLTEPLDERIFRSGYSDIALLGKAVRRDRAWRVAGFAVHALNGAIFGLAYHEAKRRLPVPPRRLALGMALLEHVTLWPLAALVDRYHPASGEEGVPRRIVTNPHAFAQATARHALFGLVLGRLGAPRS